MKIIKIDAIAGVAVLGDELNPPTTEAKNEYCNNSASLKLLVDTAPLQVQF